MLAELDNPQSSVGHAQLIQKKRILREIYVQHYLFFQQQLLSCLSGVKLELGSGGGFIREILPEAITSDVVALPALSVVAQGEDLPFCDASLAAIMMVNVLHHMQDVGRFFSEATRCLKPGGVILMVEPANTLWSRFIYKTFHHEPFDPGQADWKLPQGGRMSVANDALPWIVFVRDKQKFLAEHPNLEIGLLENFMPFSYLISGGLSKPQLIPSAAFFLVRGLERCLTPLNNLVGMFMRVKLVKRI